MARFSFAGIVFSFLGVAVFLVCMYAFALDLGNNDEYNVNMTIPGSSINFTALQSVLDDSSDSDTEYLESFTNSSVLETDQELSLKGTWGIMKDTWNTIKVVYQVLAGGVSSILGIPRFLITTLLLILTIFLIFAAWKTMRTGEP